MRRFSLLLAGATLWLFLAAIPALADGGPHLTSVNSGSSSLTADSCAGCHRAHTAQGEYLLAATSEQALCLSCHGNGSTGATTNVEIGIQYVPAMPGDGLRPNQAASRNISAVSVGGAFTTTANHGFVVGQTITLAGSAITGYAAGAYTIATVPTATTFTLTTGSPGTAGSWSSSWPTATGSAAPTEAVILGALRDGGFSQARINSSAPSRGAYIRGWNDAPVNTVPAISTRPKVGALGSSAAITSAHIDLTGTPGNGIADTGTVWGKSLSGLGTPTVTLGCVDCHNPHGNNNYRILRPVPGVDSTPLGSPTSVPVKATYNLADTIVTTGQHRLVAGDTVQFTGMAGTGISDGTNYVVISVVNGFTFKVATALAATGATTATNITADTTPALATVIRTSVSVADVSTDPDGNPSNGIENPTKNYTIIQTKGSQGVNSTYLLYARDVLAARAGTGVAQNQTAVNVLSNTTSVITTSGAHGLATGDRVQIAGLSGIGLPDGVYTVSGVSFSGSFTLDQFSLAGYGTTAYTVGGNQTGLTAGGPYAPGTATVQRLAITGNYGSTGGDYFHRSVPWDPRIVNPSCDPTVSTGSETNASSKNAAFCGSANDAPNGRPAAILQVGNALTGAAVLGQQAFNDQITTWCSQCHTRYYSGTNENVGLLEPATTLADTPIALSSGPDITVAKYAPNGVRYGGPSYGDKIQFKNIPGGNTLANATDYYVIMSPASAPSGSFEVSLTQGGAAITASPVLTSAVTFTRTYQSSNSSWSYPSTDSTFKYQHQTTTNRACTTCHVAHGSNASMLGQNGTQFALNVPYPDGTTTSTSSRLLKIDNRGTCQACHDPTGTVLAGTYYPLITYSTQVP